MIGRIPTCLISVDVGGGSVANGTPHSLARIALRWMIRECFKADTGIMFTSEGLRSAGIDPAMLYPYVQKRPPPLDIANSQLQYIQPASSQKPQPSAGAGNAVQPVKSEEEHELLDAMSPVYDQLRLAAMWWILELMPVKQHYQKSDNSWSSYLAWNLGRGRFIPKQLKNKIKIHRSVKMRMDAQYPNGKKYTPSASFKMALERGNIEWVD